MKVGRLAILLLGLALMVARPAASGAAAQPLSVYADSVFGLIRRHERQLPQLTDPATATAAALGRGAAFYLAGDPSWVAEGIGRAGGLIGARSLEPDAAGGNSSLSFWKLAVKAGDVVWIAYTGGAIDTRQASMVRALRAQGCVVIGFGPAAASGSAQFNYWIDSFTTVDAEANLTRMGNILSLWTLVAEVAAAASREGRTLAFYQSTSVDGGRARNALYSGVAFHDGIPHIEPVPTGDLAAGYLKYIRTMLHRIYESERAKIKWIGQEVAKRATTGQPAVLMPIGHMITRAVGERTKLFQILGYPATPASIDSELHGGGYLVLIGYVGVDLDLWQQVRREHATAAWIVSSLPTEVDFAQWGDTVVNQHWPIGDCAIAVPGYDVRILPPSAVAQLFIYELLLRAAGELAP